MFKFIKKQFILESLLVCVILVIFLGSMSFLIILVEKYGQRPYCSSVDVGSDISDYLDY